MPPVAVAVSGGVDSLVAAHLLIAAGHRVVGLHFLTGFEPKRPDSAEAVQRIQAIGDQLDIPVHVVDLQKAFRRTVVDYFARAYQNGLTPNPCLVCNPSIKFGVLLSHAERLGATALATGHYAQIRKDAAGRPGLYRGVDRQKDQSYFLSRLAPDQLIRAIFPLGQMTKTTVRQIAKDRGLEPVTSDESQDVCFIRGTDYAGFLENHLERPPKSGPIVNTEGRVIGEHQGLHRYTVGQRRGISCPAEAPYYVVRIDTEANRLVVGFKDRLAVSSCRVADVNWIRKPDLMPARVAVQLRYRHRPADATIALAGKTTVEVVFQTPQSAVTPGQGAVFYQNDEVLGGGWILPETEA